MPRLENSAELKEVQAPLKQRYRVVFQTLAGSPTLTISSKAQ